MGAFSRVADPTSPSWTCASKWWPVREAACPILAPLSPDCGSRNHAHPAPTRFRNQIAASRGYSGTSRTKPIWPQIRLQQQAEIPRSFQVEEHSKCSSLSVKALQSGTAADGRRLRCSRTDSSHSLERLIGGGVRTKRFFAADDRARPRRRHRDGHRSTTTSSSRSRADTSAILELSHFD
jgi:hypothetical protein